MKTVISMKTITWVLCGGAGAKRGVCGEREWNGDAVEAQSLADQGLAAAKRGHAWLSAFWAELTPDERKAAGRLNGLEDNCGARVKCWPPLCPVRANCLVAPGSRSLRKESNMTSKTARVNAALKGALNAPTIAAYGSRVRPE
jgi:hypothetical protein